MAGNFSIRGCVFTGEEGVLRKMHEEESVDYPGGNSTVASPLCVLLFAGHCCRIRLVAGRLRRLERLGGAGNAAKGKVDAGRSDRFCGW